MNEVSTPEIYEVPFKVADLENLRKELKKQSNESENLFSIFQLFT